MHCANVAGKIRSSDHRSVWSRIRRYLRRRRRIIPVVGNEPNSHSERHRAQEFTLKFQSKFAYLTGNKGDSIDGNLTTIMPTVEGREPRKMTDELSQET